LAGLPIERWRYLDIGAGAGFPGLPLKIARPQMELALLEAKKKRVRFLQHLVERLELPGVAIIRGRAEELGRKPGHRASRVRPAPLPDRGDLPGPEGARYRRGIRDFSGGPQGLGGADARGEGVRVAPLYGPEEPGSGGEGGSHAGKIPPLARDASQAAIDVGLLEPGVRQGYTRAEAR